MKRGMGGQGIWRGMGNTEGLLKSNYQKCATIEAS